MAYKDDKQELVLLEDVKKYLNEKGLLKVDLFNEQGTLVWPRAKIPPKSIDRRPFYVYHSVIDEGIDHLLKPGVGDLPRDSEDKKKQIHALEKTVGKKTVQSFHDLSNKAERLFEKKPGKQTFNTVRDIMENSLKEDQEALASCIQMIRDVDTYTYHHSLAVGLRFRAALKDLREYSNEDWFYDVFKPSYGAISFAAESMKNYAAGAFMHDYGKIRISPKILQKADTLSKEEFEEIKNHSRYGVEELKKIGVDDTAILSIAGNHHAAYMVFPHTGQGPLAAICSIIDIHDACRSKRSYKEPFSYKKTREILDFNFKKYGWDPNLYHILVTRTIPRFERELDKINDILK